MSSVVLNCMAQSGAATWGTQVLANPIRVDGGAIFGLSRFLSERIIDLIGKTITRHYLHHFDKPMLATAGHAIRFFGSYAGAWWVLTLAGFSFTASQIVLVTGVSLLAERVMAFVELLVIRPALGL